MYCSKGFLVKYVGVRRVIVSKSALFSTPSKSGDSTIQYTYRLATADDIPFIEQCNMKTLPEHYGRDFYTSQLREFPKLSVIAENRDTTDLVGYILGQVKETWDFTKHTGEMPPPLIGHCGSVAVYNEHRGQGVAKVLMTGLHANLAEYHGMDEISLLCRPSNVPALTFYTKTLRYEMVDLMPKYYIDGEDAWYMVKKNLLADLAENRAHLPTHLRSLSSTTRADGRVMIDCTDSRVGKTTLGQEGGGKERKGLFGGVGSLLGGLVGKTKGKI